MVRRFRVGSPSAGTRLDVFLVAACSDLSRSRIQKLIAEEAVRVGGAPARRSHVVRAGEEVSVEVPEPRETELAAEDIPLSILYEDERAPRDRQAPGPRRPSGARATLGDARQRPAPPRPGPGRDRRRASPRDRPPSRPRHLGRAPRREDRPRPPAPVAADAPRTLRKEYLALVAGVPPRPQGRGVALDRPRSPRPEANEGVSTPRRRRRPPALARRGRSTRSRRNGSRSASRFCAAASSRDARIRSACTCRPRACRSSAIRFTAARATRASGTRPSKRRLIEFPRQALHAERVAFRHPATQELVEIVAPVPPDLAALVHAIEAASG